MKVVHMMRRGGRELYEYKKALKMAKHAIDKICELTEEMEDQFSNEEEMDDEFSERRMRRRSASHNEDWDEMQNRSRRDY